MPAPPTRHRIERIAIGGASRPREKALLAQCHEIRRVVFVEEQGVPAEIEWDGLDDESEHFVVFEDGSGGAPALGTARMRLFESSAKAERVAVHTDARGRGLGRRLMDGVEASARAHGCEMIRLNAQRSAQDFYERLGYTAEGAPFTEAGIEHLAMIKRLD